MGGAANDQSTASYKAIIPSFGPVFKVIRTQIAYPIGCSTDSLSAGRNAFRRECPPDSGGHVSSKLISRTGHAKTGAGMVTVVGDLEKIQ